MASIIDKNALGEGLFYPDEKGKIYLIFYTQILKSQQHSSKIRQLK